MTNPINPHTQNANYVKAVHENGMSNPSALSPSSHPVFAFPSIPSTTSTTSLDGRVSRDPSSSA